jgi:hypothetical protein
MKVLEYRSLLTPSQGRFRLLAGLTESATHGASVALKYLLTVAELMKTLPTEDIRLGTAKNICRMIMVSGFLREKSKIMRE